MDANPVLVELTRGNWVENRHRAAFVVRDGQGRVIVSFPREWLRDPDSRWLRDFPSDVPWDDPGVLKAMVALRHE